MEELNTKLPLFKKVDRAVFESIDKFKLTPNYNELQDFYNGLEEEQQKVFKAISALVLFLLPIALLGVLWLQNAGLKEDLNLRVSIIERANEILGQKKGVRDVRPNILSSNPIDSSDMMSSKLSTLLTAAGVDLGKIQVKDFESASVTSEILRSEANFAFSNMSTDELINAFITMIQKEKFRIQEVSVKRNSDTNTLQGTFHAVHFSIISSEVGEE